MMQEVEVFRFNEVLNDRGVYIDRPSVDLLVEASNEYTEIVQGLVRQLTNGRVSGATAVSQSLRFIKDHGIQIPDLKAETVDQYLSSPLIDTLPDKVKKLLEYRRVVSRSSTKKFIALQECVSPDNRIHGMMFYHGAHTGRWTSRLAQLHNFPRGDAKLNPEMVEDILDKLVATKADPVVFIDYIKKYYGEYGSEMDILTSLLRPMICAPAGKKLIVYDYSGIEARVLAWLSGCTALLNSYAEGRDVYKLMATKIYDKAYDEITKEERQWGKAAVLGCGYGMGAAKFVDAAKIVGVDVDERQAKMIVDSYRNGFSEIPSLWRKVNAAMRQAISGKESSVEPYLNFYSHASFTFCILPSQRHLSYPLTQVNSVFTEFSQEPVEEMTYMGSSNSNPWHTKKMYGAKIVENVVQAISRDLMVDAMLKLEKAGFPVVFSVHDEIVCEVEDKDTAPERISEFVDIMSTPPEWGAGLPLEVEGYVSQRYRK
jgi:DNA polymerase